MGTSTIAEQTSMTLGQATRACGLRVLLGAALAAAALGGLGYAIENRETIAHAGNAAWAALMFGFSLGGHFWGAVALGAVCLSIVAWTFCVDDKLRESSGHRLSSRALLLIGVAGVIFWLLSSCAMHACFETFAALTIYQGIAVVVTRVLYGIFCFSVFVTILDKQKALDEHV